MVTVLLLGVLAPAFTAPPRALEARWLMEAVTAGGAPSRDALQRIIDTRDLGFAAVLIELLRASQAGIVRGLDDRGIVEALRRLSGQPWGDDWIAWTEWCGGTSLAALPGFTGWKGRLLGRVDPRFEAFLRDGVPTRVRVEEIQWGGVTVDGIPALNEPPTLAAGAATYLTPNEPVGGLVVRGDARAYPLRILDWHELVNDVVGGVPVALTYCPLCGTAIAYARRTADGRLHTFGTSGLLFRSNKLMYDRETRTLWDQLTGEALLGPLAARQVTLTPLPVVVTSWAEWRNEHPATRVLDIETGYDRLYVPGAAYGPYFASPATMFPVWRRSRALPAKARVYALRLGGAPKAYPLNLLARRRVVNDVVGGTPVVLVATRGVVTVVTRRDAAVPDRVQVGNERYEAGGEVRAYARAAEHFVPGPDPGTVLDSQGRRWRVTEDALVAAGGRRAPRVDGFLAYWFAWYSFFPRTEVYGPLDAPASR